MIGQRKACTKCEKEKDFEEFGANKGKSDGRESWCKECISKQKKKRYEQKKKEQKVQIEREQKCQSSVLGNLTEDTIINFCQIFSEIYRGLSYDN